MPTRTALLAMGALLLGQPASAGDGVKRSEDFSAGLQAYESSDYGKAAEYLKQAATNDPRNAEIQLLLAKTYYEAQQRDEAIDSAEKAVSLEPQNSVYHEWLGRVYGEKADHSGMFTALSLARKAHKEFETAVAL